MKKVVYVSGKYSGNIDENIHAARLAAIKIWEHGNIALTPHLNTAHFEIDCNCKYEDYIEGDLELLERCDAVVMLPGWEESAGAVKERNAALIEMIPIFYFPDMP